MSKEKDETAKSNASLEFHDFLLKEMRTSFADLRGVVEESKTDTAVLIRRLDDHIESCDKRYVELRTAREYSPAGGTTALVSKPRIMKKLLERAIDYGILVAIMLIIFAFKNGFSLPLPTT
jgi:hypothetical protein